MSDSTRLPRNDSQSTFFLKNKQIREENLRAYKEDQMITSAMGGPLAEQEDGKTFQRVLHVACGAGVWTINAAVRYPQMVLVGIDNNSHIIDYARENAVSERVAERVTFQVMDAISPLELPDASFDLVNMRLGVTFLRTWEWPRLLAEMLRVVRPGGVIRLTEPQIIHVNKGSTSNPALLKLHTSLVCAFYRAGHLFEENTTGITAHLGPLLMRYGCKEVQTKTYSVEILAGTPEWKAYYSNALAVMQGWRPFLTKWGCISSDYDDLYQQAVEEMRKPDYHISWNFLTVWSNVP